MARRGKTLLVMPNMRCGPQHPTRQRHNPTRHSDTRFEWWGAFTPTTTSTWHNERRRRRGGNDMIQHDNPSLKMSVLPYFFNSFYWLWQQLLPIPRMRRTTTTAANTNEQDNNNSCQRRNQHQRGQQQQLPAATNADNNVNSCQCQSFLQISISPPSPPLLEMRDGEGLILPIPSLAWNTRQGGGFLYFILFYCS